MIDLDDVLRIPHTLTVESLPGDDGTWVRRVSYKSLDGCVEEGTDLHEMIENLEIRRVRTVSQFEEPMPAEATLLRRPAVLLTAEEIAQALGERIGGVEGVGSE